MVVKKSTSFLHSALMMTLALMVISSLVLCFMMPKNSPVTAAATDNIGIFTTNNTINNFGGSLDSDNDPISYGSAYPADLGKIVVQFYNEAGALQLSRTLSFLNDESATVGATLTENTFYNVKIITSTFVRYTVQLTFASGDSNSFSSPNFTIFYSGDEMLIDIIVTSIRDESWLTDYVAP